MNWLANLFSSASSSTNDSARRKMALSTHDAFSLPTSSPITASHPDSFARGSSDVFDIESMTPSTSTYAYPPPASPTTYDYLPRQNGRYSSQSRQNSLLPMHSAAPLPPYPPLEQTWTRIRNWLTREYPELGDTLNYGILPQDLTDIELALGMPLPQPVRESYLVIDGQEAESAAGCSEGLFFGLYFLPLEDVLDEWRFWREVDNDPATGRNARLKDAMRSVPADWVRREYSSRGWIPLVSDKTGNYLGVDLDPGGKGIAGQVIVFGRDFDTKVVMWRGEGAAGWANWLAAFVEDLESGEGYELGPTSDGSEDSEDDVGYESYFFDGSGRRKGDGDGESGGGLRLSGEYRGWSVLEAWADKSVKRWRDTGVIPEKDSTPMVVTKDLANHRISVLDIPSPINDDAAEIPIPVFSEANGVDSDGATPTAASMRIANSGSSTHTQTPLPTISVTKPPIPRPVDLPSPGEFRTPSPESTSSSFEVDLERGGKLSMDEVEHPLAGSSVVVRPTPPTSAAPAGRTHSASVSTVKEGTLVQLPTEEEEAEQKTPSKPAQDLLVEISESVEVPITPIEPVTTPVNERKPVEDLLIPNSDDTEMTSNLEEPAAEAASPETLVNDKMSSEGSGRTVAESSSSSDEKKDEEMESSVEEAEEEEQDPNTTIRLVGGGGTSGVLTSEPETDSFATADSSPETDRGSHDRDRSDTASLRSESSVGTFATADGAESDSASKAVEMKVKKGKHDKKKSFSAGLKRISQLGGGSPARKRTESKEKVGAR